MEDRLSLQPRDKESNLYPLYIASGTVFFVIVNYLTQYFVPDSTKKSFQSRWKWRNVLTSFVHSTITGIWSCWSFYSDPSIRNDMIHGFNKSIHILVCFSIGYFIYDFFDMYIYHKKRSTYELLIHHFMVVLCYGVAASTRLYVAYGALSLVIEVNSIFLHARQLFIIAGVGKHTESYRTVSLLNVTTFVFFRILLLGWMTRWVTLHRDDIPLWIFTIGSLGLATIMGMSIILFFRVLQADFFNSKNKVSIGANVDGKKRDSGVNFFETRQTTEEVKKCQ